nr:ComEC/Rec2 family competence protein [Bittarella massiliensis (ex Durand et al. 2017)]
MDPDWLGAIPGGNDLLASLGLSDISIPEGEASVHFIDVGQGDASLILVDGHAVLIDGGENDKGDTVVNYLKNQGVEKLDLIVATHPHSDHIGGLDAVMAAIPTDTLLMPRLPQTQLPTTKTYKDLLTQAAESQVKVVYSEPGQQLTYGDGRLTVLGPLENYDDLNDTSAVVLFRYGSQRFLFTGDMEARAEEDLLEEYGAAELKAQVLKLGHHGSSTSTSAAFLDRVNPEIAVACVGEGNSYGHPHQETVDLLANRGIRFLRTDQNGAVVLSTDGSSLQVICQKGE